jgi:hypothetical protein
MCANKEGLPEKWFFAIFLGKTPQISDRMLG